MIINRDLLKIKLTSEKEVAVDDLGKIRRHFAEIISV
jgi:hypothetical protein